MNSIDRLVIDAAIEWHSNGHIVWLCTVISTFGSSPRPNGSLFVAKSRAEHVGSLSGGCVEEAFLENLENGCFDSDAEITVYGDGGAESKHLGLPCGGVLKVLVERLLLTGEVTEHLLSLRESLDAQQRVIRQISFDGRRQLLQDTNQGAVIEISELGVRIRIGPVVTLLLAGISPVASYCAEFAKALGFDVIVCDPREDALQRFDIEGVTVHPILPSVYIMRNGCHSRTAVVALTHDPKIDDLAIMEAVKTEAFYIGAMGSQLTSVKRAQRLLKVGGLSEEEVERVHMPVGLAIGSKTPPEIALAVVSDIVRSRAGIKKNDV